MIEIKKAILAIMPAGLMISTVFSASSISAASGENKGYVQQNDNRLKSSGKRGKLYPDIIKDRVGPNYDGKEKDGTVDPAPPGDSSSESSVEKWAVLYGTAEDIFARDNAKWFNDVLVQHGGWPQVNIKLLTTWGDNSNDIINAIQWVDSKEDENDIVVFYICGHGEPGLIHTWRDTLTREEFHNAINELESQNMAIIFDTCFAESMGVDSKGLTPGKSRLLKISAEDNADNGFIDSFVKPLVKSGRVLIASCRAYELSEAGVFSRHFIYYGLGKGYADANQDGWCSVEEAFEYSYPKVVRDAPLQHPVMYDNYPGELDLTKADTPSSTDVSFELFKQTQIKFREETVYKYHLQKILQKLFGVLHLF